jgi:hypothetical protein
MNIGKTRGENFFAPADIFVLHNLSPSLNTEAENISRMNAFEASLNRKDYWKSSSHSPTILSSMNIDSGGCVDSWHSYTPSSSFRAFFIRSAQFPKCLVCSTRNRSSLLYVLSPTVNNKKSFRRNQLTWNGKSLSFQSQTILGRGPNTFRFHINQRKKTEWENGIQSKC